EADFYMRNRSAAHFGAHSVVNNRKFKSVDLIYDPMLRALLKECSYPDSAIKQGAIMVDLIREIHSEALAIFPYDNRVMYAYNEWSRRIKAIEEFSCFAKISFPSRDLSPLGAEVHD